MVSIALKNSIASGKFKWHFGSSDALKRNGNERAQGRHWQVPNHVALNHKPFTAKYEVYVLHIIALFGRNRDN